MRASKAVFPQPGLVLATAGSPPVTIAGSRDVVEAERLSGVRLERDGSDVVDLLFASSGIEGEVAAAATRLDVLIAESQH